MAKVNQRMWKIPGQRTKPKAWGFTVQVPCNPCPHRHEKTGEVLHPDDVRQVRSYKAEWTREDAEKELAALLLNVDEVKPVQAAGMTIAEAAKRYLAAKVRKRTLRQDERTLEHLKSAFGADTALADITASRISEYKAARLATKRGDRTLTAAAVNRPLALLRHLLRVAHEEWEAIPTVPKIRLEREPQGRLRWLTEDEIRRLLDACAESRNPELRPAVIIALNTGLRRSELLELTWDRVDLSRGVIRLELTKSGKRREVPLNSASYAALVTLGPEEADRAAGSSRRRACGRRTRMRSRRPSSPT